MSFTLDAIQGILSPIEGIVGKFVLDKTTAAQLTEELQKQVISGIQAEDAAQSDIDKTEAASSSLFVSGWRPAIGWCCALGVWYAFFILPLLMWTKSLWFPLLSVPEFDTKTIISLTMSMLGLGGLRTIEKVYGVAKK